jgi:hypothetical protein
MEQAGLTGSARVQGFHPEGGPSLGMGEFSFASRPKQSHAAVDHDRAATNRNCLQCSTGFGLGRGPAGEN